jgi:hypothetical protein
MTRRVQGLDRGQVLDQLHAVSPAFTAGTRPYGAFDPDVLRRWGAWAARFGIVDQPPNIATTFAPRFAATAG